MILSYINNNNNRIARCIPRYPPTYIDCALRLPFGQLEFHHQGYVTDPWGNEKDWNVSNASSAVSALRFTTATYISKNPHGHYPERWQTHTTYYNINARDKIETPPNHHHHHHHHLLSRTTSIQR